MYPVHLTHPHRGRVDRHMAAPGELALSVPEAGFEPGTVRFLGWCSTYVRQGVQYVQCLQSSVFTQTCIRLITHKLFKSTHNYCETW